MPPHTGVGVHRPLSFAVYGASHGWRIDAFEGPAPNDRIGDELLSRTPAAVKLHTVPTSAREPSHRFFPRVDGGFPNAIAHAEFAIDVLKNDPPDLVLASAPSFFRFVAARFVARRFGVPLVLDYRDEWTECPFDFVSKDGDDLAWERRCLAEASAVLFVTRSLLEHQVKVFPELDRERAYVIPNGWEPADFPNVADDAASASRASSPELRVAHVGNLAGHTPPFEFLASLEKLLAEQPVWISRLRVSFIGRRSRTADAAIRAFPFPSVLEIVDHVSKRDAVRRMHDADILLLLAAPALDRSLPSKLFEYIASRRPVLIFGSPGEASALVERLGAGALCPAGSPQALGDTFVRLRALDLGPREKEVSAWLEEHRRDALAARAFEILDSVIARDSPAAAR
jgi:glycosyltransferase involved in cell wall biosynthesis